MYSRRLNVYFLNLYIKSLSFVVLSCIVFTIRFVGQIIKMINSVFTLRVDTKLWPNLPVVFQTPKK